MDYVCENGIVIGPDAPIFPLVEKVVERLRVLQKEMSGQILEVRLQVMSPDAWIVHPGMENILSEHGYWGGSAISAEFDDNELFGTALELLSQAYENYLVEHK